MQMLQAARGVAIDPAEQVSLMINEEDHLRIQCIHSGLDLEAVWAQIRSVDEEIEAVVPYAFHQRWGYLTACPTNVGTGIRVSVMLHLPALVITRQIDKVFEACTKFHWPFEVCTERAHRPSETFIRSQTR